MSWMLFLDESAHDHKNAPCEVHGGFAIRAAKLWPFIQAAQTLECRFSWNRTWPMAYRLLTCAFIA